MDIIENKLLPAVKKGNLKSVETLLDNEAVKPFFNHSKGFKIRKRNPQGQYFTEDGFLMIHVAAAHGHTELVKLFLGYFEVDVLNKEFETPLMVAVFYNQEETVKFLLDSGANVNHQSDPVNERSILLAACAKGHGKIVKLLLDHGAKLFSKVELIKSVMATGHKDSIEMLLKSLKQSNYKYVFYKEALHVALDLKDVEMTKIIMENGMESKNIIKFLSNNGFLVAAVSTATVPIVQSLWDAGVDDSPKIQWSALHEAASINSVEMVKLLLEEGANQNLQDKFDQTPLHQAVEKGHLEIVKLLIEEGADLEIEDESGETPLHLAVKFGNLDIVKLMSEKGADLNIKTTSGYSSLYNAVANKNLEMVKLLVEEGANVNIQNKSNETATHCAVREGYVEMVKFMSENGANLNIQDESGRTVLHYSLVYRNWKVFEFMDGKLKKKERNDARHFQEASNEDLEIIELFIEKGANLNIKDIRDRTVLHYAVEKGYLGLANFLLDKGADVNVKDAYQETPLHVAAKNGDLELLKLMVEKGGDVNIRSLNHKTLLHYYAGKYKNLDVVKFLLDQGADVNIQDIRKETPLHLAAKNGELEMLELMMEKGGDVNIRGINDQTLLECAAERGNLELVKFLIDQGLDVNAASFFRSVPCHIETFEENQHIANYLFDFIADIDTLVTTRLVFTLFIKRYKQSLCRQIVKMQSESLFVAKSNLKYIDKYKKLRAFAKGCKKELDCMKEQKFDDTVVSLYEVFVTKDLLQLAAYASNENIINYVKSREFMSKFPIYNVSVQRYLQRGCHRNFLLKRVCNFSLSLSRRRENKLPRLPPACVKEIFNYLSNRDLQNLRKSYY